MLRKKILLGIREDSRGYKMVGLAYRLRELGFYAKVLKTEVSENFVPLYYIEDIFEEEEQDFDLCVIGPGRGAERQDELASFVDRKSIPVLKLDDWEDLDHIVEKIQVELKGNSLEPYSFLFTLGLFNEHLTNNHFIGVYEREGLMRNLIREIVLAGGHVSVIAGGDCARVAYAQEVIRVSDVAEFQTVLDSRAFRCDIVINAIRIPRFGLARGEKFTVEYRRYFAEFSEKYLPFADEELYSGRQLIVEVSNSRNDNPESIRYLFDNTRVSLVLQSEISKETGEYKPFIKLIHRDGSTDVVTFKDENMLCKDLLKELLAKLEG